MPRRYEVCNNDRELERDHLTSLPALDMPNTLCIVRDLMRLSSVSGAGGCADEYAAGDHQSHPSLIQAGPGD